MNEPILGGVTRLRDCDVLVLTDDALLLAYPSALRSDELMERIQFVRDLLGLPRLQVFPVEGKLTWTKLLAVEKLL